ncbi:MAG: hypothetical protein JWP88_1068, partial [Flaviaesturariibacter sp.]|nr:hypothetical protein [Flaviaesturariibacter sp.]
MIFPTKEDRRQLAEAFQLPFDETMQDWEVEVADSLKLPEFIVYIKRDGLPDSKKVSLIQLIFQSIEDLARNGQLDLAK